ncbi:MAG: ribonuclease P protein component [Gammaproteobacteria bacterium]|nr:ribonuclease P protein component [Gammaproteobacteria bacterium]
MGESVGIPSAADYRFPLSARLARKREFDRVFRRPQHRFRNGPLRLVAAENRMCASRLGVVAPRRVLRRAIDRNRAKRHIRESFRYARARLPNCDIVIVVTGFGDGRPIRAGEVRRAADALWEKLCREP